MIQVLSAKLDEGDGLLVERTHDDSDGFDTVTIEVGPYFVEIPTDQVAWLIEQLWDQLAQDL